MDKADINARKQLSRKVNIPFQILQNLLIRVTMLMNQHVV